MVEKVKVSREVAEAIEYLLNHKDYGYTKEKLLTTHAGMEKYSKRSWVEEARPLNELDLLVLAEILVNGYEVETTPEEKVQELYWSYINGGHQSEGAAIRASFTLYGIQIEGVNS